MVRSMQECHLCEGAYTVHVVSKQLHKNPVQLSPECAISVIQSGMLLHQRSTFTFYSDLTECHERDDIIYTKHLYYRGVHDIILAPV